MADKDTIISLPETKIGDWTMTGFILNGKMKMLFKKGDADMIFSGTKDDWEDLMRELKKEVKE